MNANVLDQTQNQISLLVLRWLPVIVGLLVLYVPTFIDLANGLWNSEDQAHGPIILIVVMYLLWQHRQVFKVDCQKTRPWLGSFLLLFGGLLYAIGRSQEVLIFEIGSMVPVLAGIVLMTIGNMGLKILWFPIIFTVFMIPLPGFIVDIITGPLKHYISVLAEELLYYFGYPIARSGVTISIGSYQLLVADACSGLHSMFSLTALGLLYMYMMQYKNKLRLGLLMTCILPIAFFANLVRVIALILITYYFGDEIGQGFIHGFAGLFLFVVSLISLFTLDGLIGKIRMFQDKKDKKYLPRSQ